MNPEISATMQAAIVPVLIAVMTTALTGIVAYLGVIAKRVMQTVELYVEAKLGAVDYAFFRDIAKDVVLSLIQHPAYKDLTGPEKKSMAILKITDYLEEHDVYFSTEQISEMIEAVYAEAAKSFPVSEIK